MAWKQGIALVRVELFITFADRSAVLDPISSHRSSVSVAAPVIVKQTLRKIGRSYGMIGAYWAMVKHQPPRVICDVCPR